jgi:hypothetical protein
MVDEDREARLTETMESRQKRGKTYPMYGREKQAELFELGMRHWESQGLQRPDKLGVVVDVTTAVVEQGVRSEKLCKA